MPSLSEIYKKRLDEFSDSAVALQSKYEMYSLVRLLAFFLSVAGLIVLYSYMPFLGVLATIVLLLLFHRLVQWHQGILYQKQVEEALVTINEQELSFMNDEYTVFDNGEAFEDALHPYSIDMDIFGDYSFFQYINRTTTSVGRQQLADYLSNPVGKQTILDRQIAIQELSPLLEWRQYFRAYGMVMSDSPKHVKQLKDWLLEPNLVEGNQFLKIALWLAPVSSIIGVILWMFYLPWFIAILFLLPAGYVLKTNVERVNEIHRRTEKMGDVLASYGALIAHIEAYDFTSPKLKKLSSVFDSEAAKASDKLKELSYIIHQLNVRNNPFAILLNIFTLWDLHWILRLENWKEGQKNKLNSWFAALSEFEALSSFATVYYNRPHWSFPSITTSPVLEAQALGHPLLPPNKCVTNDVHLPTEGHIKLLTGSNMAGKSTFLRTVGLNIVLAMAGAPVCADRMSLPVLQLYTSMRTQDALHESTSSFYAELKRLKMIIEAVEERDGVFFLMDEILKGTNSKDRHTGGRALINQMIKSKGGGIIATHDLELGAMAEKADGTIENLCIEVDVEDGKLKFDYKLKKGVSKSFNATVLMREMGIKV